MDELTLDREWGAGSLLRFTLPTVVMMLFMGFYTMVDTIFVARLVHTDALSAINIVCPVIHLTVGLGTMLATGGNAIIARKMGEGRLQEAREDLTLIVMAGVVLGVGLLAGGSLWLDQLVEGLGASRRLFPYCRDYLAALLWFFPAGILQTLFSNLLVTAGRPGLGFGVSVLAGLANIGLDWFFIIPCHLGIQGAALGTGISYLIPAVAGMVYFARGGETLRFARTGLRWSVIQESCRNGSSEMVSQLATALTTFLFNRVMLELAGEDGVAAITILIYAQFLLNTLFIGYSMGVAPVISFCYGRGDSVRQRRVFDISMGTIGALSAAVFILAMLGGPGIVRWFVPGGSEVCRMATEGFGIFAYSFLFCGMNIFTSAMFTALSNGGLSAGLSFLRTFGLLAGSIVWLPRVLGVTGVWLAVPVAEGVMVCLSAVCLVIYRDKYHF